ncbi:MAG: SufD family Fe-S cluster assembly protein [Alphaproteobacteria bacterium]|nr:SufD family Fe-S cluster assembly protein [Alphaproteobacteria bacterium]
MPEETLIIKAGSKQTVWEDAPISRRIIVESGAKLLHYRLQEMPLTQTNNSETIIEVQENAVYESFILQTGAEKSFLKTVVNLVGEKASAFIGGIYLAAGKQKLRLETEVYHKAENTISEQQVRGVAADNAEGEFVGLIDVAGGVKAIIGNQMHKALMLSETAGVKCVPELAIASEDVKCTHGSSIGMLDENQLFYLQSRGIPLSQARFILTSAFLAEILNTITEENCLQNFRQKVETWLFVNMK